MLHGTTVSGSVDGRLPAVQLPRRTHLGTPAQDVSRLLAFAEFDGQSIESDDRDVSAVGVRRARAGEPVLIPCEHPMNGFV